jgi:hypothetical protein
MARDGWGAPRIHGELLKLGFDGSEVTVSRYMPRQPLRPLPLRKTDPLMLIKANPLSAQSLVGWSEALKGVAGRTEGS